MSSAFWELSSAELLETFRETKLQQGMTQMSERDSQMFMFQIRKNLITPTEPLRLKS